MLIIFSKIVLPNFLILQPYFELAKAKTPSMQPKFRAKVQLIELICKRDFQKIIKIDIRRQYILKHIYINCLEVRLS